jgi:hypothetical protein
LTVAAVPTGMKAGVRISPRCIAITPARAEPSVAEMEKEKRVTRRRLAARRFAATLIRARGWRDAAY